MPTCTGSRRSTHSVAPGPSCADGSVPTACPPVDPDGAGCQPHLHAPPDFSTSLLDLAAAAPERAFLPVLLDRSDRTAEKEGEGEDIPTRIGRRRRPEIRWPRQPEANPQSIKIPALLITEKAIKAASVWEWPGNLRQLRQRARRAVDAAAFEESSRIELRHIFPEWAQGSPAAASPIASEPLSPPQQPSSSTPDTGTFHERLERYQREMIQRELESTTYNVQETALRLSLSRSRLYALMAELGIKKPY